MITYANRAVIIVACFIALRSPVLAQRAPLPADTLHGTVLVDSLRWLEEDTPERSAWLHRQDSTARAHLASVAGAVELQARVLELAQANSYSIPAKSGDALYYLELVGATDERRIRFTKGAVDSVIRIPTAEAGFRLSNFAPSPDGTRLLVGREHESAGRHELVLLDLTGVRQAVHIPGGVASERPWRADGQAFVFARVHDGPDTLFLADRDGGEMGSLHVAPNADARLRAVVSESGRWIVLEESGRDGIAVLLLKPEPGAESVSLSARKDADGLQYAGEHDGRLVFRATRDAPNGRVVVVDPARPDARWAEWVRAGDGSVIEQAFVAGGRLLTYTFDGPAPHLEIRDRAGRLEHAVAIPVGLVWTDHLSGWPAFSAYDREPYAYFRSLNLSAPGIYRVDMRTGELTGFRLRDLGSEAGQFETQLEWYRSQDGTRVPMFVTRAVNPGGARGPAPALVYAYGAYGFTPVPFFNAKYLAWLEQGGVFAVPYLRGGGGMGQGWHEAGRGANKRNTVADLNAAAEYLISRGYTSADLLTVEGQGPGGTVAASAILQRPDLWAAAALEAPVTDPIRGQLLRGRPALEYGDATDEATFRAMLDYAPLHRIGQGRAPAVLVRTGDHDRVVQPHHSYKFVAALQNATPANRALLRIDWNESHGFLRAVERRAADWSADLLFLRSVVAGNNGEGK